MSRRMHAFFTDAVKNARLLRRSRLPRPQNTRQHFGHSVYSFFMDFLIFLFYPPCLFILLLLCTTCSWKHIPPELSYKHIRFGFEIEHAHKIHQSSIHHCVAHERLWWWCCSFTLENLTSRFPSSSHLVKLGCLVNSPSHRSSLEKNM